MKRDPYGKDITRTIAGNLRRFLAIVVITILGVTMFSGLQAACEDLRRSGDRFFDDQALFDLRVMSTLGLTDDDVKALRDAEGIAEAEGVWQEAAAVRVADNTVSATIRGLSGSFDQPYLLEGRMPGKADEALVTRKFLDDNGAAVGDVFTVRESEEDDSGAAADDADEENEIDFEEEEGSALRHETFRIVGVVTDVQDVDNTASGSVSFRRVATNRDTVYVLPEAFDTDLYAVIYLRLAGAAEERCYDESYKARVAGTKAFIEDRIMEDRERARYEEVLAEANEKIDEAEEEAEEELADARKELEDGEETLREELEEAEEELADGEEKLADGRQQLEDGEAELEQRAQDAEAQIAGGQQQLAQNRRKLEEADRELKKKEEEAAPQLKEAEQKIADGRRELDTKEKEAQDQIAAGRAEIASGLEQIEAGKQEAAAGAEALAAGRAEAEGALPALQKARAEAEGALASLQAAAAAEDITEEELAALTEQIEALQQQLTGLTAQEEEIAGKLAQIGEQEAALAQQTAEMEAQETALGAAAAELDGQEKAAQEQFAAARAEIDRQEKKLNEQKEALKDARRKIDDGLAQLKAGEAALVQQSAYGRGQIAAARTELEENRKKLEESEKELAEGRADYEKGKREGEEELAEGWEEYRDGEAEAEEKIADARARLADIEMADWYVQDRTSLSGYANIGSDADSIEAIATVFPIVFLIVAVLISLTAIARMVEEDRGLIGTYKALGFTDREIRRKYLVYTGAAGGLGAAVGTLFAFLLLPRFVFWIFSTMYLLPSYTYTFLPKYGIAGAAVFAGGVMVAAWMACRSELQNMPAALMRPRAPKPGMRVFLEKIPPLWKRLSFLNKITARNLFRYKGRMLMTIAGIAGCTALLLFGFAIGDSVRDLMPRQYDRTAHYDLLAVAEPGEFDVLEKELRTDEVASYTEAVITSASLKNADGKELDAQVIAVPRGEDLADYITTETTDGEVRTLRDGEVFVTQNAENVLQLETGKALRVQLPDLARAELAPAAFVKNYLGNYVYMTEATYEEAFGDADPNAALVRFSGSCSDPRGFCSRLGEKEEIVTSISTLDLLDGFDTSFALINMVVYVVIVMSAALAFVVLFTLAATNISERERELATIKVLGFHDREVHQYIDKEALILTAIGIVLGIPLGMAFAQTLTSILNIPSVYLAVSLHPVSYVISAALSFGFSLIVNAITDRALDRIDPVTALKSVE